MNILTNSIGDKISFNKNLTSGDNESYYMFPDDSKILCQLIDDTGVFIKADGSFGEEKVWCKVYDQRCFYSDILYLVIPLSKIKNENYIITSCFRTRGSLTFYPESKMNFEQLQASEESNIIIGEVVNDISIINNLPFADVVPVENFPTI